MRFILSSIATLLVLSGISFAQSQTPKHPGTGKHLATARYADESRDDTIGEATTLGLIYVFDVIPDLQLMHNEAVNAEEGQYSSVYEMLDGLISISVPQTKPVASMPNINGYQLGETWAKFVAASPKLRANVARCATKKQKKKTVYDSCASVRRMSQSTTGSLTMDCLSVWSSNIVKDMVCRDFDGEVRFTDGKLSGIKIISNLGYKDISDSMVAKFGSASGVSRDDTSSLWHTSGYDVAISSIQDGTAIDWETPGQHLITKSHELAVQQATME